MAQYSVEHKTNISFHFSSRFSAAYAFLDASDFWKMCLYDFIAWMSFYVTLISSKIGKEQRG